ncbi:MAG: aminoglycoside phosphotransferase family protein [Gaiellales bacterium]
MIPSVDLAALEPLARAAAAEHGLELGAAFPMSNYSYVAPAGETAVVKVRWPEDDDSLHEAEALRLWGGDGAVRLLETASGALLLERAQPGDDLAGLPEDEAVATAIDIAHRLWRPAAAPFRRLGDLIPAWLDAAAARGGPDHELVPLARELFASLAPGRTVLVHGDFHHHNLLRHGDWYVAIDPKPMLGEPEFDVPSFLWNPVGSTFTVEVAERRIAAFVEAGLDDARIRTWAVIRGACLGHGGDDANVLRGLLPTELQRDKPPEAELQQPLPGARSLLDRSAPHPTEGHR